MHFDFKKKEKCSSPFFSPSLELALIFVIFSVFPQGGGQAFENIHLHLCTGMLNEYLSLLFPAVVFDYVSAVLSDVLHSQRDPLPLCLALLQYDKELAASKVSDSPHPSVVLLHRYYCKWLPQQCREELVSFEMSPSKKKLWGKKKKKYTSCDCKIPLSLSRSFTLIGARQRSCQRARRSATS